MSSQPLHLSHANTPVAHYVGERRPAQYTPRYDAPRNSEGAQTAPHKKFVAKGHDAQLQDAQMNNLPVVLTLMSGGKLSGAIVKRDKFTITLRHTEGDEIFYKHAIEGVLIKRETLQ